MKKSIIILIAMVFVLIIASSANAAIGEPKPRNTHYNGYDFFMAIFSILLIAYTIFRCGINESEFTKADLLRLSLAVSQAIKAQFFFDRWYAPFYDQMVILPKDYSVIDVWATFMVLIGVAVLSSKWKFAQKELIRKIFRNEVYAGLILWFLTPVALMLYEGHSFIVAVSGMQLLPALIITTSLIKWNRIKPKYSAPALACS